ncbi:hypothetical protein HID58_071709 [Brassica napus]|uniref:Uncharacterized protein n=2 Tax=Brassica napus TaxID=3708 RepID=A0ABQ7Z2F0_BRANA|nr:hypothetical protein HID58_071709 [Brassica napus]CDY53999.1 BnaC06g43010D [Brassica napus]
MERSSCKESIETNRVQIRGALEYEMGDAHMAIQARLMNQALHKLSHSLYNTYHLYKSDTTWCCLCCGQVWRPVYRRESLRCNVRLTQLWQSRRLRF